MTGSRAVLAALLFVFLFAAASASAEEKHVTKKEEPKGLSALAVRIHMKAEHREQFLKEMRADAIGSEKNEPGCLMFNIAQDAADPNVLYLFEVYKDDAAVEAHKKTPHFQKWLETTKPWLAAPLEIHAATTLYPPAKDWKKRPAPAK